MTAGGTDPAKLAYLTARKAVNNPSTPQRTATEAPHGIFYAAALPEVVKIGRIEGRKKERSIYILDIVFLGRSVSDPF